MGILLVFVVIVALIVIAAVVAGKFNMFSSNEPAAESNVSDSSMIADETDPGDESAQGTDGSEVSAQTEPAAVEEEVQPTGILVCLDAGHGGNDNGTSSDDRIEKTDTLRLVMAIKDAMEAKGIEVYLTREDDTYIDVRDRGPMANDAGADYFISIHRNSAGGLGQGVEVWKATNASEEGCLLADNIMAGLEEVGISRNRGVRTGSQSSEYQDYEVLRTSSMPGVLIEMGFVEIDEDNQLFDDNLEAYAEAITQAVLDTHAAMHGDSDGE
jgi:N-acetylmuramoyl-L-alanine amidase